MLSKRLSRETIRQDIISMNGLNLVPGYKTDMPEATPEALQAAYTTMVQKQDFEAEQDAIAKQASESARQAEEAFHSAVLAMKNAVKGQFGDDSKEVVSVGLKRKSERRKATRQSPEGE